MSNKKRVIVDGVNVSKCPYLYIHPKTVTICCTHRRFGGCHFTPNCHFKEVTRLKCERKTERIRNARLKKRITEMSIKQDYYRRALEDIEEYIKKYECDNCENFTFGCGDCGVPRDIIDIINSAKGYK